MTYQAPVDDIVFALKTAAGLDELLDKKLFDGLDIDTVRAVIEEAGKFGAEVLGPLDRTGDKIGSKLKDGVVETPPGFREAYQQFAAGGWSALPCPPEYGGQGLPEVVAMSVCEIWNSANLSFGLCPLLTQGAIDAITVGGSDALKAAYLPNMIAGKWTGTMNLTEPHAGSDLGILSTKAERAADGTYRIAGTKIFITYGDHEMAENIIHLVLARLPDAPPGTRGISLFLVPKYLVNSDGTLGARNDVICAGLEHKLGIMASPTCVMKFGEKGGAVGFLVGEENRGLATMFIMMNAARLAVGVQGVAVAERATQRAIAYAKDRRQGRAGPDGTSPIIAHPDIKRIVLTMRAQTQAARMICLATAREMDVAHHAADAAARVVAANRAALLTPVAKGYATDIGVEVASLGIQIHGGMGFIEETGAAQHWRDSRILPIYEGTNGIQAIDLVMRKLPLEGGAVVKAHLRWMGDIAREAQASNRPELGRLGQRLVDAVTALGQATQWMGSKIATHPDEALAGATPYARLFGLATGAAYLTKGALSDHDAKSSQVHLARFFGENILPAATGLASSVMEGADAVLALNGDGMGP
jgi:acyl-CoA dehydrogenase